jgi:integrase
MSKGTRRQYGSGSVFQRKDGIWIGRFEAGIDREGRRRPITVSAKTEQLCKERLEAKKLQIARDGVPEKGSGKVPTVQEWCAKWLDVAVDELRPGSYRSSASAVKVWIIPTIGRKRLDALTPADVRAVHAAQRQAGRKESSVVRTHAVLMKVLKDAVREDHYVRQSVLLSKSPRLSETDDQAMAIDDALAVLAVASKRPDATRWAAALLQAMRQGECLGLTREMVDFEAHQIDISWQLQRLPYLDNRNKHLGFRVPAGYVKRHLVGNFHLVRPKSRTSRRIIPMVPWMEDGLRALFDSTPENAFGLVWPDGNGLPRDAKDDRKVWHDMQTTAEVRHPSGRPFKTHEARHTTATLLLELGIPKDVVESIMGHSKFVESYDHSNKQTKIRAALEQLAEQLALTT